MSVSIMITFYGILQTAAILIAPSLACDVTEVLGCLGPQHGLVNTKTTNDRPSTMCKCLEDLSHRCPLVVGLNSSSEYFYHVVNIGCKLSPDLQQNKINHIGHVLVKRGSGRCSNSGLRACVQNYETGVARNPTDVVHSCGLIVTFLSCMKRNTAGCPSEYNRLVGLIRETLNTVQEACGFDICIPRDCTATTPSWFRTCDTQRAIACVSGYHNHLRSIHRDLSSKSESVLLNAYRKLADYKTACRYLTNPTQIEACVTSAMSTCTNPGVKYNYHSAVVKLVGFCEQAKDCDRFGEAVENIKDCYVRRINELVADNDVTKETIACRFAVAALKCQHDNFAVCPLVQDYLENNLLLGTGTGQFEDDCEHYILPWEQEFHSGHPTRDPAKYTRRPTVQTGVKNTRRPTVKTGAKRSTAAETNAAPVILLLTACIALNYYN